jgi:hypothetical protein
MGPDIPHTWRCTLDFVSLIKAEGGWRKAEG